jgi:murein DD-endopeptidase MepM/ murein hydrolase activator NlpD
MIRKGQDLALIGSTGHSTGPHLHFEVLKNGVQVDPLRFIGEVR